MFNSKTKSDETPNGSTTIIGAGTTINGDIESSGDIRIDGTLIGNLIGKAKVLIGAEGYVEGAVKGKNGSAKILRLAVICKTTFRIVPVRSVSVLMTFQGSGTQW